MIQLIRQIAGHALLILTLAIIVSATAPDLVGIDRTLVFKPGAEISVVSGRINGGTIHIYRFRALENQEMSVVLKTGDKTSLTIFARRAGILENADGVRKVSTRLPESGEYLIEIGTEAAVPSDYTLEVSVK